MTRVMTSFWGQTEAVRKRRVSFVDGIFFHRILKDASSHL